MIPTLLIVDDEACGRESLESLLVTQEYNLVFASNGTQALEQARHILPDLILLDVMMPDMDGYEVCRRLRSDPLLAEVPVVMVTALDDRESRLHAIDVGVDDFITKPIDRAELRARVRTITRLNRYRRLQDERAKLERQLERLTALRTIDLAITSSLDMQLTLAILLLQVTNQLNVDAADVLLFNPVNQVLEFNAGHGFWTTAIESSRLRVGEGLAGRSAMMRRSITVPDLGLRQYDFTRSQLLRDEGFKAYFGVPLIARGEIEGVLEVFLRVPFDPDEEWLNFLDALGEQAAIAINNAQLFERLQHSNNELRQAYDATLEGWSRALDLRDKETENHTQRVTEMTERMAHAVGMSDTQVLQVRRGALLHDIGKLGIPDAILQKPGPLTEEEWVKMRTHPSLAYDLLSPIAYLVPALEIPFYHHERWDGTGYPNKLKGEEIPLAARMFAIVDVWDALSSDRAYRPAWPPLKVREYLIANSGSHFDPNLVEVFLGLL